MTADGPVRAVEIVAGAIVVVGTLGSAVRTVVLPRAVPARLTRVVFLVVREVFLLRLGRAPSYELRDRVLAPYAPIVLLTLLWSWLLVVWLGYGLVMLGLTGHGGYWPALRLSGSSLLTLGFAVPAGTVTTLAVFSEATVGLVLLALLITYLPSLYSAFSRRENLVSKLEVRAGAPPTGVEMLARAWALERFHLLHDVWLTWEDWFVDVEETHTTFPALSFFRSPQPDRSWVTAAGAVLDAAGLYAGALDTARDIDAELCIRAGYLALRGISEFFRLPHPHDPRPDDPISVTRDEFEAACDRLARSGAPVRADRDAAWRDFAGWRVNYDLVLVSLAGLTMAPYAPWSSDRSLVGAARPRALAGRG